MSRETPLLPSSDARETALFFVIGALCFLTALAVLTLHGTYKAAANWSARVEGEITIVLHNGDYLAAETVSGEIAALASVVEARPLSREEVEALITPSLGAGGIPDGLPVPVLIVVQADMAIGDPVEAIRAVLDRAGIDGDVASNADYVEDMHKAIRILRLAALSVVALLSAIAIAVIAFATHAALLARSDIIDILRISGAEDRYITRLFKHRFFGLTLRAGFVGVLTAFVSVVTTVFAITGAQNDTSWLLPDLEFDHVDMAILLAMPVVAGLTARITAQATAMIALKGIP